MNDAPQIMDQTDKKVFTILLVVVGVICIVVVGVTAAAFYTVNTAREKQIASLATEQVRATSTAVSATSTAIYQATQVANYEFFDDFEDNENDWETNREDNEYWRGTTIVHNGTYIWNIKEFYKSVTTTTYREHDKDNKFVKDFDLSVDAKLITPNAHNLCYGVAFHNRSAHDGYEFVVCDDQQFVVKHHDADTNDWEELSPWAYSNAIRTGDWNTLAVSARGDHYILYVNGVVVSEFTDSHHDGGYVHLVLACYDPVPGTVMFDNFGLQPR